MGLMQKLFGSHSDHELKRIYPIVNKIEALEPQMQALSDEELRAKTAEFKARYADGEDLDSMLPEAFAAVREAAWRVLGMKPFRVQLIGGIVLHQGRIAEMKTGEGKDPRRRAARVPERHRRRGRAHRHRKRLPGRAATASGWARCTASWASPSASSSTGLTPDERRAAYNADITYGTNNELGFDYLRDNMAIYKQQMVQRGHAFAIVDEVDSILIDEARTPLIILRPRRREHGPVPPRGRLRAHAQKARRGLHRRQGGGGTKTSTRTTWWTRRPRPRRLPPAAQPRPSAISTWRTSPTWRTPPSRTTFNQALKAHGVMKRDIDYVVKDGEVIIVDEFTGRLMLGRRYFRGPAPGH